MKTAFAAYGVAVLALLPLTASAALGPYAHGYGIKSLGFGGVAIAEGEETTALIANPAHAYSLNHRYDIGLDLLAPMVRGSITGNAAGPDETIKSRSGGVLLIPQGGYSTRLSDRLGLGVAITSAGLGPDYPGNNPYRRFGGGDSASLALTQAGVLTALGYAVTPSQTLGASVNLVYQTINIKGVAPFAAASETPAHVSNQGIDARPGAGFAIGWHGRFSPWLAAGAAYTSKTWTQRHKDYEGLIPDGGKLELPARYGVGAVFTPHPKLTVAMDAQRFLYRSEAALGNGIEKLNQGHRLGAEDGPGFGLDNQNAYKLGLAWQATPGLCLRAGYIYATQMTQPGETLFAFLAPTTTRQHYTMGATHTWTDWELSGYAALSEKTGVNGQNSIPSTLGGGEANVANEFFTAGFSLGRHFGVPNPQGRLP